MAPRSSVHRRHSRLPCHKLRVHYSLYERHSSFHIWRGRRFFVIMKPGSSPAAFSSTDGHPRLLCARRRFHLHHPKFRHTLNLCLSSLTLSSPACDSLFRSRLTACCYASIQPRGTPRGGPRRLTVRRHLWSVFRRLPARLPSRNGGPHLIKFLQAHGGSTCPHVDPPFAVGVGALRLCHRPNLAGRPCLPCPFPLGNITLTPVELFPPGLFLQV